MDHLSVVVTKIPSTVGLGISLRLNEPETLVLSAKRDNCLMLNNVHIIMQ